MLATALVPDGGHATVMGFDVVDRAEDVKLCIGYMPQRFTLYGDLTVSENIDFFADLYQVPPANAKKKKDELLKANNLENFKDRLADQLSGGMKKKLALACTLIHTPDVIILDEPTTGVDPLSRRELWRILYSLIPRVTIVVSTPYMDEAERCSRVGLFFNGRIVISDLPINVINSFRRELLEIKCARMRDLKKVITQLPGIMDVQIFGDSLHAHVDFAEKAKVAIEEASLANGFIIDSMQKIDPKMEDVFISILKARK
jgi:ABC-2 type transport system ATP-binding protein